MKPPYETVSLVLLQVGYYTRQIYAQYRVVIIVKHTIDGILRIRVPTLERPRNLYLLGVVLLVLLLPNRPYKSILSVCGTDEIRQESQGPQSWAGTGHEGHQAHRGGQPKGDLGESVEPISPK